MMKVTFSEGVCRVDNVKFGYYNGTDLLAGTYDLEARYSHKHGRVLPHADGLGWIGSDPDCAIIIGKVRNRADVLPDGHLVRVLTAHIEAADESGIKVLAEVI